MFKAVLSGSSSRAAALFCWHVLGLRIQRAARIVEVTVRACQLKPSLRCGHVLGLLMLLNEASRLVADKVLVQMRGYFGRLRLRTLVISFSAVVWLLFVQGLPLMVSEELLVWVKTTALICP